MIHLEKINGENIWDILKLNVSDSQKNFVASNDISIIEAYTAITSNGYAFPFGIFEGNNPVGFVMIGYDKDDYWKDAPAIADGNYNLWRLMIDKNYQNRGYGKLNTSAKASSKSSKYPKTLSLTISRVLAGVIHPRNFSHHPGDSFCAKFLYCV